MTLFDSDLTFQLLLKKLIALFSSFHVRLCAFSYAKEHHLEFSVMCCGQDSIVFRPRSPHCAHITVGVLKMLNFQRTPLLCKPRVVFKEVV